MMLIELGYHQFYQNASDAGHTATPAITFDYSLFHRISFQLKANEILSSAVEALPEVEKIWPVEIYMLPAFSEVELQA